MPSKAGAMAENDSGLEPISRAMPVETSIAPWLAVPDGAAALAYYEAAFGAVERYRLVDDAGRVMVAQMTIDRAGFWLQEDPDARPETCQGSVRMILTVDDPDAVFASAVAAGATEIAAVHEDYGWRIGRLADPFGHHWEVGKPLAGRAGGG
jgi:PhnB protein